MCSARRFAEFVLFALSLAFDATGGRSRHFGFEGQETLNLLAWQVQTVAFFNQSKMGMGAGADKADGQSRLARTAGATDAVCVIHGGARQVEVHHDRKPEDINPAGGEVGGEKHPHVAGPEVRERPAARALAEIAVQGGGHKAGLAEFFRDMLGGVFCGDKHKDA